VHSVRCFPNLHQILFPNLSFPRVHRKNSVVRPDSCIQSIILRCFIFFNLWRRQVAKVPVYWNPPTTRDDHCGDALHHVLSLSLMRWQWMAARRARVKWMVSCAFICVVAVEHCGRDHLFSGLKTRYCASVPCFWWEDDDDASWSTDGSGFWVSAGFVCFHLWLTLVLFLLTTRPQHGLDDFDLCSTVPACEHRCVSIEELSELWTNWSALLLIWWWSSLEKQPTYEHNMCAFKRRMCWSF
jgi:hypothetical protein